MSYARAVASGARSRTRRAIGHNASAAREPEIIKRRRARCEIIIYLDSAMAKGAEEIMKNGFKINKK